MILSTVPTGWTLKLGRVTWTLNTADGWTAKLVEQVRDEILLGADQQLRARFLDGDDAGYKRGYTAGYKHGMKDEKGARQAIEKAVKPKEPEEPAEP
jgi:hypothetical protein